MMVRMPSVSSKSALTWRPIAPSILGQSHSRQQPRFDCIIAISHCARLYIIVVIHGTIDYTSKAAQHTTRKRP